MKAKPLFLGLLLLFLIAAPYSRASYVLSPTEITSNSAGYYDETGPPNFYVSDHIIDQSGLHKPFVNGATDWESYFDATATHSFTSFTTSGTEWFARATETYMTFKLGGRFIIDGLAIWNEDSYGISSFTIWLDDDNNKENGTLFEKSYPLVTDNPRDFDYEAQIFEWDDLYAAAFVHFHGVSHASAISLGEIAFKATPTPLPPAAFLLFSGLLGLASYRRFNR